MQAQKAAPLAAPPPPAPQRSQAHQPPPPPDVPVPGIASSDSFTPIGRADFALSVYGGRLNKRQACCAIVDIIRNHACLRISMLDAGYRFGSRDKYNERQYRLLCQFLSNNEDIVEEAYEIYKNAKW